MTSPALELWASPEPTIARIDRNRQRDQRRETGHFERDRDIALLADLKVAASRYPVLWESVAPDRSDVRDYAWEMRRLGLLAKAGIEPIVTLLHHGSGPRYTSLVDPAFPELFAAYAAATARTFPWVRRWTPINEPLTTARFSTLYGVWFPNQRNDRAFGAAIVNEALGFLLAARKIRSVVADAEIMLTEDLQSFTAGDEGARAYVAFKRERSFLSLDLLCGRVGRDHALWEYLTRACGIAPARLQRIQMLGQAPDVVGWNYYPNSERFVRTRPDGTFGNEPLVDAGGRLDPRPLLRAAWNRHKIPLALSEVHVLGNEAERVRWLLQRYEDARALRCEGVDICAVGAWAAFGMVDWNSLLRDVGPHYEDGIYSCSPDGQPQPTQVAEALRALASGVRPLVQRVEGWWERGRIASGPRSERIV